MLRDLRRRASLFIWPSLAACVISYFSYHLIQGDRGILAWQKLVKQLDEQDERLQTLRSHHHQLEHRVKLLRHHICPDLLEEEAKKVLGYVHPDEAIIPYTAFPSRTAPSSALPPH